MSKSMCKKLFAKPNRLAPCFMAMRKSSIRSAPHGKRTSNAMPILCRPAFALLASSGCSGQRYALDITKGLPYSVLILWNSINAHGFISLATFCWHFAHRQRNSFAEKFFDDGSLIKNHLIRCTNKVSISVELIKNNSQLLKMSLGEHVWIVSVASLSNSGSEGLAFVYVRVDNSDSKLPQVTNNHYPNFGD